MHVDEAKQWNVGSDHNLIEINGRNRRSSARTETWVKFDKQKWAKKVEKLTLYMEQSSEADLDRLHKMIKQQKEACLVYHKGIRGNGDRGWWDEEVKQAINLRKYWSRMHRQLESRNVSSQEKESAWLQYIQAKKEAHSTIQNKISKRDREKLKEILDGPRSSRSRLFCKYIRRNKETQEASFAGIVPTRSELDKIAVQLFGTEQCDAAEHHDVNEELLAPTGIQTSLEEVSKIIGSMNKHTAAGLDEFSLGTIKSLGDPYVIYLVKIFNAIFNGARIPESWRRGRVALIPKSGADNSDLTKRRPLTISTVSYRIFMSIFKNRLMAHTANSHCIGNWQCAFREGFRIDDHIFVMTQIIEISRLRNLGCYVSFLDIKKAYDSVDRHLLYTFLLEEGVDRSWVNLLKEIYSDCRIVIKIGKIESSTHRVAKGLKQGCPASPVLFLFYIERIARALHVAGLGWFIGQGEQVLRIPIMLFADDIALVATSSEELQEMLTIVDHATSALSLTFNPEKSGVVVFNGPDLQNDIFIQGKPIPILQEYKYLGILFSTNKEYLRNDNFHRVQLAERGRSLVQMRSLWSFSKYIIARNLWRSVVVPGVTYGNAIVDRDGLTQKKMERI